MKAIISRLNNLNFLKKDYLYINIFLTSNSRARRCISSSKIENNYKLI